MTAKPAAGRPHRVIVVGAGLMGAWHLRTARQLGAEVVGVVDRDAEAAKSLAKAAAVATFGDDLTRLVAATRPDVAHVCTPVASHHAIVVDLLDAGIDVLVEKPFARTAAAVADCVDHAARSGRQVCPVHQYAFQSGVERALGGLAGIGPIERIAFDICSAGAVGAFAGRDDDVIAEIVPHPLALLQRLLPEVDLGAVEWRVDHPAPGNVAISTLIGETVVSIWISLAARPTRFMTTIHGRGGTIAINGFHGYSVRLGRGADRRTKLLGPFRHAALEFAAGSSNLVARALAGDTAYPGLRSLVGRFYAAASGVAPSPISAFEMVSGAVAYEAITRAVTPRALASVA